MVVISGILGSFSFCLFVFTFAIIKMKFSAFKKVRKTGLPALAKE